MIAGRVDAAGIRLERARNQLDEHLVKPAPWPTVEALLKEVSALEALAQRRRRRRSFVWVAGFLIAILSLALLLHLIPVRRAEISFVAATRALVVHSGPATMNVLAEALPVREIAFNTPEDEVCFASGQTQAHCDASEVVRLNTLTLNAHSSMLVRVSDDCVELQAFEGGATADITRREKSEPAGPNRAQPRWRSAQAVLSVGDILRLCPAARGVLQIADPIALVTADRTFGAAEREDMPALLNGTLSIDSSGSTRNFRTTDVVHLRGLDRAVLLARLDKQIDVGLVGQAADMTVSNGLSSGERSLMPTLLEWLFNSRAIRWILGVLGAIVGPILAIRERLLIERSASAA